MHPAPFSYLDLRVDAEGVGGSLVVHDFDVAYELSLSDPNEVQTALTDSRNRERLIELIGSRLEIALDGRSTPLTWTDIEYLPDRRSVRLDFTLPAAGSPDLTRIDAYLFPYDPVHQTFVNVYEGGTLSEQAILSAGRTTHVHYAGTMGGARAVARVFVPAGVEHILIGPDHILFLVGLILLGGSLLTLTAIVTAFTLGHSITLSLAALGMVTPPTTVVEPLIALSIVIVGADNLLVRREGATGRDIRPYLAGLFGLIHGFGFASVLREFGLPRSALGWSLFSFNVGVELGQLAIVVVLASALALVWRRRPSLGARLAHVGSIAVIAIGGYWFVERVFLTGGAS